MIQKEYFNSKSGNYIYRFIRYSDIFQRYNFADYFKQLMRELEYNSKVKKQKNKKKVSVNWAPFCIITVMQRGMKPICLWYYWDVEKTQVSLKATFSLPMLLVLVPLSLEPIVSLRTLGRLNLVAKKSRVILLSLRSKALSPACSHTSCSMCMVQCPYGCCTDKKKRAMDMRSPVNTTHQVHFFRMLAPFFNHVKTNKF